MNEISPPLFFLILAILLFMINFFTLMINDFINKR